MKRNYLGNDDEFVRRELLRQRTDKEQVSFSGYKTPRQNVAVDSREKYSSFHKKSYIEPSILHNCRELQSQEMYGLHWPASERANLESFASELGAGWPGQSYSRLQNQRVTAAHGAQSQHSLFPGNMAPAFCQSPVGITSNTFTEAASSASLEREAYQIYIDTQPWTASSPSSLGSRLNTLSSSLGSSSAFPSSLDSQCHAPAYSLLDWPPSQSNRFPHFAAASCSSVCSSASTVACASLALPPSLPAPPAPPSHASPQFDAEPARRRPQPAAQQQPPWPALAGGADGALERLVAWLTQPSHQPKPHDPPRPPACAAACLPAGAPAAGSEEPLEEFSVGAGTPGPIRGRLGGGRGAGRRGRECGRK